ncbi:MAG: hypothetical protein AAF514_12785, partial [Verrucomicrobiota bacterium]
FSNLVEYGLGFHPERPERGALVPTLTRKGDLLEVSHPINVNAEDIFVEIKVSDDLETWVSMSEFFGSERLLGVSNSGDRVTYRIRPEAGPNPYFRVEVVVDPES